MTEGAKTGAASDISTDHWLFRVAPNVVKPYLTLARVDRPIGTWLLLLPCWWGAALAGGDAIQLVYYALLFAIGAFVMRGAGCVWNDILDRDYDAKVARTAMRPIASGTIGVPAAAVFMACLSVGGLCVLVQFNLVAIVVALSSLVLVALYPLMKRITYWPQAWLGLTFNWGALVGWAAVAGSLDPPIYFLYAAGFFWTLGYDTIYAHQDKEDDALVDVRSTALLLGERTRLWLVGFYAVSLVLLVATGLRAGLNSFYYTGVGLAGLHFVWQVWRLDIDDARDCLVKFKSNKWLGILIAGAIIMGSNE